MGDLDAKLKNVLYHWEICIISICRATIRQVTFANEPRLVHHIRLVAEGKNCLHAHHHMLEDMAMHHPHSGIGNPDTPPYPARCCERLDLGSVRVQHGRILIHWISAFKFLFVFCWVVQSTPTADVIEMSAMSMKWVALNIASTNTSPVLPDDLEGFMFEHIIGV